MTASGASASSARSSRQRRPTGCWMPRGAIRPDAPRRCCRRCAGRSWWGASAACSSCSSASRRRCRRPWPSTHCSAPMRAPSASCGTAFARSCRTRARPPRHASKICCTARTSGSGVPPIRWRSRRRGHCGPSSRRSCARRKPPRAPRRPSHRPRRRRTATPCPTRSPRCFHRSRRLTKRPRPRMSGSRHWSRTTPGPVCRTRTRHCPTHARTDRTDRATRPSGSLAMCRAPRWKPCTTCSRWA